MSTVTATQLNPPNPSPTMTECKGWKIGQRFYVMTREEDLLGTIVGFRFICGRAMARVEWDHMPVRQYIELRDLRRVRGS